MLVCLPWVGLLIGLIWYGLFLVLERLGVPVQLEAALLVGYPYLVTGFIHLDGFMDTNDAILSRRPLEDKLRILKDPHTGAFAVISVVLLMLICYGAMASVVEHINLKQALGVAGSDPMLSLILIPMLSRCGSAMAVMVGKPLSHSQYKGEEGKQKPVTEIAAVGLTLLLAVLFVLALGAGVWTGIPSYGPALVLAGTAVGYLAAILHAAGQLKGVSGDLAGYALTTAEAVGLILLVFIS